MKILELIENAINHKSITGGRCFTCGGEPSRGLGEHVIPKWLLTQLSLWDSKLTLINGTRLPYRQLRVPCCEKCNNEFMSQIEDRAKAVFTAQQVRDGDDVLNLGRWMSKILVGILTVETRLLIDRQNPSKGFILDAKFLDNFHLCHLILQTARKQTSFSCLHSDYPFSLYWYIVDGAEASNFDFITDIWGNAVAIQIGRLGVVFVADGGLQMEVGEKGPYDLSGSVVSIAKFRELVIRIFYKSQLRDATHFYINSEMPDTMSVNQSHVTPYTGMIPGTEMIQIFRDWNEDEIRSVLNRPGIVGGSNS